MKNERKIILSILLSNFASHNYTKLKFALQILPFNVDHIAACLDQNRTCVLLSRTLSTECSVAQQKIIDQMNLWDNEDCETQPGDTQPHGQKCLYHVS